VFLGWHFVACAKNQRNAVLNLPPMHTFKLWLQHWNRPL